VFVVSLRWLAQGENTVRSSARRRRSTFSQDGRMRIAQVAPLYEPVPPRGYGGTERVVSWITEELVREGHQVTLFASGDSLTRAELVPVCPVSLRTNPNCHDTLAHHILLLEQVRKRRDEFDIVHYHIDYLHFPLSRQIDLPQVTTLHGRLDLADLVPVYREFADMPVISISHSQRLPLPQANWVGNVYHGLPEDSLPFHKGPGKYLAFIGRISPEKRPDRAIEIATRAGMRLKIAAKIDAVDRGYFERVVSPLLKRPNIEFIGEIGDEAKAGFLGNAIASIAPIDWPEPFGLNMIEAMACGTPTIAFAHGSVPEIIEDGVSGIIVRTVDEAVEAVHQASVMSRRAVRASFVSRFTASRMVSDYLAIYEDLIFQKSSCSMSGMAEDEMQDSLNPVSLNQDSLDKDAA
jgi:glycosyltransferase involved in cell wall biosynthesis